LQAQAKFLPPAVFQCDNPALTCVLQLPLLLLVCLQAQAKFLPPAVFQYDWPAACPCLCAHVLHVSQLPPPLLLLLLLLLPLCLQAHTKFLAPAVFQCDKSAACLRLHAACPACVSTAAAAAAAAAVVQAQAKFLPPAVFQCDKPAPTASELRQRRKATLKAAVAAGRIKRRSAGPGNQPTDA
jgi:hypothetical protein